MWCMDILGVGVVSRSVAVPLGVAVGRGGQQAPSPPPSSFVVRHSSSFVVRRSSFVVVRRSSSFVVVGFVCEDAISALSGRCCLPGEYCRHRCAWYAVWWVVSSGNSASEGRRDG